LVLIRSADADPWNWERWPYECSTEVCLWIFRGYRTIGRRDHHTLGTLSTY